ncbi:MAG TPA: TlpA disulfide reductase family protein [Chitinophagales bacterium]|nr:TlpA disulfide reductase family protein [Chitinophagales bacterium]
MNYYRQLLFIILCTISTVSFAQTFVPIFDLPQYQNRVLQKNDTLYVVNFWATWCKPCVEELPLFQTATIAYKDKPVKIILVSQDAKSRVFGVEQFLNMRKYTTECFLLSAGNPNIWIEKIEPRWSGTIPATILYKNGENVNFQEGDFPNQKTLEDFINSKL